MSPGSSNASSQPRARRLVVSQVDRPAAVSDSLGHLAQINAAVVRMSSAGAAIYASRGPLHSAQRAPDEKIALSD
jgi:hypothetical protein